MNYTFSQRKLICFNYFCLFPEPQRETDKVTDTEAGCSSTSSDVLNEAEIEQEDNRGNGDTSGNE